MVNMVFKVEINDVQKEDFSEFRATAGSNLISWANKTGKKHNVLNGEIRVSDKVAADRVVRKVSSYGYEFTYKVEA